jgi:(p)ppGpp synthase/HD superfamily hydrolase
MILTPLIQRAINRASQLHHDQKRRIGGLPYMVHPYSVGFILSHYTNDDRIIAAGLLHDVLEDVSGYTESDMTNEFGPEVVRIVKEVTEDKNPDDTPDDNRLSWETRKTNYLANLQTDSYEGLMVCCADKIHNLQSMAEAYAELGDRLWSRFHATKEQILWFHQEIMATLKTSLPNDIVAEYERVFIAANEVFNDIPLPTVDL